MANFFSLGSSSSSAAPQQDQSQPNNNDNNNPNWAANSSHPGLLLYRNEEIYQKGFEIWQQYVQVHHHPKLVHQDHAHPFLHHALYLGGDPMAGPSSVAGARSSSSGGSRVMMRGGGGSSGVGVGGINCQDCGNQAKKDCSHMRCRTCCKSRGFDCSTHVKSTWVPAAKRRERQQQQMLSLQHQQQQQSQQLEIGMRDKRRRESLANAHTTTNPVASRMGASASGLEVGQHFPPEVSSPAVFRCVRVHSVDNADEQLAYQTAVNIGGHLFKGILYDQGPGAHYPPAAGDTSSGGEPTLQHHNLLTSAAANNPENPSGSGAATCVDPNAIYPPPISAFLAGTQFFPPPRS